MTRRNGGDKVVIVGATGLVGSAIVETLERLNFPASEFVPVASARSAGSKISFKGSEYVVQEFNPSVFKNAMWVFFSGKDGLSDEFCPAAAKAGAWVIDNSSAFRMDENVPLIVPEVNPHAIGEEAGIIANPNCSTIQLAVALEPIRRAAGIKKVIVSTYQSSSGAGGEYLNQLIDDSVRMLDNESDFPGANTLAFNVIPAVGANSEDGRFSEETKLENELRKILEMPDLPISATAVRVPTKYCHAESVVIETEREILPHDARVLWGEMNGVEVLDDFENRKFPTPLLCERTDPVWVGRIRKAGVFENDLAFWVVADNILKGAALNAVQIAQIIKERQYV